MIFYIYIYIYGIGINEYCKKVFFLRYSKLYPRLLLVEIFNGRLMDTDIQQGIILRIVMFEF